MPKAMTIEEQIAQLAKNLGAATPEGLEDIAEARREADSVILYLENPQAFRETRCRHCDRQFATNYQSVSMCSDHCRIEHLRSIGIEWNPMKTQAERWAGRIPLTCGPDALALAKQALSQET